MERVPTQSVVAAAVVLGLALATLTACGGKKEPESAAAPAADTTTAAAAVPEAATVADAATAAQPLTATATTWTPEALEELMAPVALYPDVVLGQVMTAATNPQEVLDAGNWKLQNANLEGKPLDEAAEKIGFTPPIRGLLQTPQVLDMMCSEMDWTTELGQAYTNDQEGVLAAVQRLRAQAKDVGNLKTSPQMKVDTTVQEGQQVITVSPPSPQVVYVPQYDPVAAYAPAPAAATTTTTTTTTAAATGHSTESLVMTGILAFGAGMLVNEIFDDDDDYYHGGYYSPHYYGPPMYYRPPYPYRPHYGNGFYPGNGYNRPPNYKHNFNNNTVIINNSGNNNYWKNRDNGSRNGYNNNNRKSPITAAKKDRPELASLNNKPKSGNRPAAPGGSDWKGKNTYAGSTKKNMAQSKAAGRDLPKAQGSYAGATKGPGAGKVPGSYAGNKSNGQGSFANNNAKPQLQNKGPAASGVNRGTANSKPQLNGGAGNNRPSPAAADRGRPASSNMSAKAPPRAPSRPSAMSGAGGGGGNDRAASQRGKQSMPGKVPAKAKQGGGGGHPKKR